MDTARSMILMSSFVLATSLGAAGSDTPMRTVALSFAEEELRATPRGHIATIGADDEIVWTAYSPVDVSPDKVTALLTNPRSDVDDFCLSGDVVLGRLSSRQLRRYNALVAYLNLAIVTNHFDFKLHAVSLIGEWLCKLNTVTNLPLSPEELDCWPAMVLSEDLAQLVDFVALRMPEDIDACIHTVAIWFVAGGLDSGCDELLEQFNAPEEQNYLKRTMSISSMATHSFKHMDTRSVIDRLAGKLFSTDHRIDHLGEAIPCAKARRASF